MNDVKITKEQVTTTIEDLKAKKGTALAAIKAFLDEDGNRMPVAKLYGSVDAFIMDMYDANHNEDFAAFKALAKHYSPYFVNTTDAFMERITKADDATSCYHCKVFQHMNRANQPTPTKFPNGKLAYIGTRTHRGKTTALISIAVDALQQGKKVLFYTNEEGTANIIMRMVKAKIYTKYATGAWPNTFKYNDRKCNFDLVDEGITDFSTYIENTFRKCSTANNGNELQKFIWDAYNDVETTMASGQFTIIDGLAQRKFEDIERTLKLLDAGDVVLLDYIQHIRRPENAGGADYKSLQLASNRIADIADEQQLVIIAGAQLGRDSTDDKNPYAPDKLADNLIRECGDLEQDAHILIEIGQQILPDGMVDDYDCKVSRFYKILKNREGEPDTNTYRICDNAGFSLYGCMMDGQLEFFKAKDIKQDGSAKEPAKATAKAGKPAQSWSRQPYQSNDGEPSVDDIL